MPIYEFRCLKCDECFEFLLKSRDEQVEMKCPHCASEDFERVMSVSCHTTAAADGRGGGASVKNRSCAGGSCTTYEIPGHSK